MFLLLVLAICFLANFVFYFEDEHLLIFLVLLMFCLSLSIINNLVYSFVETTQSETFRLLIKEQVVAASINQELKNINRKIALLVSELVFVTCVIVEQASILITETNEKQTQCAVQESMNKYLLVISEELSRSSHEESVEFVSDFLKIFDIDEQDE